MLVFQSDAVLWSAATDKLISWKDWLWFQSDAVLWSAATERK